MPSFKVTRESDHCQIGRLRYLIDLPEQNLSVLLSFTHREGKYERSLQKICQYKSKGRVKKVSFPRTTLDCQLTHT